MNACRSTAVLLSGAAFLSLALFQGGSAAAEERHYSASATSSAEIEVAADGTLVMHTRNVRLVPYGRYELEHYLPRLATVTTDVKRRTDAEGTDPASTVSVTVDDVSADPAQRLASFTDPGADGDLLTRDLFDSWMPGCCGGATVHYVRSLEDGSLLFRSTGDGDAGSTAWFTTPDNGADRWAAFDGAAAGPEAMARGIVGTITYGTTGGPESRVQVRVTGKGIDVTDLNLGLSHVARLVWADAVSQKRGHPAASGTPDSPETIWSLEGVMAAEGISGFSLRLLNYDGKPLATIPIEEDRMVPSHAKLAKGIAVDEVTYSGGVLQLP